MITTIIISVLLGAILFGLGRIGKRERKNMDMLKDIGDQVTALEAKIGLLQAAAAAIIAALGTGGVDPAARAALLARVAATAASVGTVSDSLTAATPVVPTV